MNTDELLSRMISAGKTAATDIWGKAESYAIPELKKIVLQIEAIAENQTDYTPKGAKRLLDMQVKAAMGVIVAMTALTMDVVEDMINAILAAVRDFVNGAVGIALL